MTPTTDPTLGPPPRRIAVIGSGVSGLVAAHLLRRDHDVHVFEASPRLGGHVRTVPVQEGGTTFGVDTGFIVFNEVNYPNFTRLLSTLGVESQPSDMSFSVRCDRSGLEYNGTSLSALFAQRTNALSPRFLGMIRDIVRFHRDADRVLADLDDRVTVSQYLASRRYGDAFVADYLLPIGAALWSAPTDSLREFPIRFMVEFMRNHSMLQIGGRPVWRTIRGGSDRYVARLVEPFRDRIHTNAPVAAIRRTPAGVSLDFAAGHTRDFDHVVVACHADHALALLRDPSPLETEVLSAFPFQTNRTLLHTDGRVLPRRRRARASWNYHRTADSDRRATVTYNMNLLQSLAADRSYNVTLNEEDAVDPASVLASFDDAHPVFRPGRDAAQKRHHELINHRAVSYCGAYWGFGFHEDGVTSALRVAEAFGATL